MKKEEDVKCECSDDIYFVIFEDQMLTMKPKLKLGGEMKIRAFMVCLWVVFSASSSSNIFVSAGSGASDCPAECSCSSSGVVVDCSNRGLTQIPSPLPKKTVTL